MRCFLVDLEALDDLEFFEREDLRDDCFEDLFPFLPFLLPAVFDDLEDLEDFEPEVLDDFEDFDDLAVFPDLEDLEDLADWEVLALAPFENAVSGVITATERIMQTTR
ncbi:MAG: hypothetical protein K2G67_02315 [Muribaculaceae bacterium]|nr:hypothetical protein [Muribaculaceae bacterium]